MVSARNFTYNHSINITYKTIGAENIASTLNKTQQATTQTTQRMGKMSSEMGKVSKSSNDVTAGLNKQNQGLMQSSQSFQKEEQAVKKSSQAKVGAIRQNRGMIFATTMLTSSLVEAFGMLGIFGDALERKNEAQAEVNRLEREGLVGTKEYTEARAEAANAERAFAMFQRNTILSMFDSVTFITILATTLLPKLNKQMFASAARFLHLRSAVTASNAAMASSAIPSFMTNFSPLPATINKTTGALTRMRGVLATMGLTNPFFLAITALGALLAAVALNVGGIRDRFNELGQSMGDAVPFLKPLLKLLGQFGEALGGIAGNEPAHGIEVVTDAVGNVTKGTELAAQKATQMKNALEEMFNVDFRQAEEIQKSIDGLIESLEIAVPTDITTKIIDFFDFWDLGKDSLEDSKKNVLKWWSQNGASIMGADVFSVEGDKAKRELDDAIDFLATAPPEKVEEAIKLVKEKVVKLRDTIKQELEKDEKLTPRVTSIEQLQAAYDREFSITVDQYDRLFKVGHTYALAREKGQELDTKTLIEAAEVRGLLLTDKEKELAERLLKELDTYYDDKAQKAEEDVKEQERIAKEEQERLLAIQEKTLDTLNKVREKGAQREKDLSGETMRTIAELAGIQHDYDQVLKETKESVDFLNLSEQEQVNMAQELWLKYGDLLDLTPQQVFDDLAKSSEKAKDKIKSFTQAWNEFIQKAGEVSGEDMVTNINARVKANLIDDDDKEGHFDIKDKIQKRINKLKKELGVSKEVAAELTIPVVVNMLLSNTDTSSLEDSIGETLELAKNKAIKNFDFSDDDADQMFKPFRKVFKNLGNILGIEEADNPFLQIVNEAIKVDWDDLSRDEAIAKLEEIKTKLLAALGEDPTDDKARDPLRSIIEKPLEELDISDDVVDKIETPLTNAFTNVSAESESMRTDLAFNFEFMAGDAQTAATNIETGLNTAFENVINKGQEVEGGLEDNFDVIWEAVDELIGKVEDLTDALNDIPNIKRTVTIQAKYTGFKSGGVLPSASSIFSNSVQHGGVIGLADGGFIVTKPMIYKGASIGEYGKPEAVIPLSNPSNFKKDITIGADKPIDLTLHMHGNDIVRGKDIYAHIEPQLGKTIIRYGWN